MCRHDRDDRLQKFAEHGSERLARALMELADRDDRAHDVVQRLLTTPAHSGARVRNHLAALRTDRRFFGYEGAPAFAQELRSILADIEAATPDPREGVDLVLAFYESDQRAFEMADDSGGDIGDVFRYDARRLFESFATRVEDKDWLLGRVAALLEDDGYGVRDAVLDAAVSYLPEEAIRELVVVLRERGGPKNGSPLFQAATLAKQLKDPTLFESIRRASNDGDLYPAAYAELAQIHLELDDAATALEWVTKMPDDRFRRHERQELLLTIHARLGDTEEATKLAWARYRQRRSPKMLEDLLAVIGEDQREPAIDDAVVSVEHQAAWNPHDAVFLANMDRLDAAEVYILRSANQLDGDFYGPLLYQAETMEHAGRFVCASVLYRSLLESILRRAKSKYYGHGARYLEKLDVLAKKVKTWGNVVGHAAYREALAQQHARKHAFWRRAPK